jgi:hypothetical protein
MPNVNLTDEELAVIQRRRDGLKKLSEIQADEPLDMNDISVHNTPEQKAVIRRKLSKILADSGFRG